MGILWLHRFFVNSVVQGLVLVHTVDIPRGLVLLEPELTGVVGNLMARVANIFFTFSDKSLIYSFKWNKTMIVYNLPSYSATSLRQ